MLAAISSKLICEKSSKIKRGELGMERARPSHCGPMKRIPSSHSITVDIKRGTVGTNTLSGLSVRLSEKAETEPQWNVLMLVNALRAEDIAVDGAIDADNASPTTISIMIGIKSY